MDTSRRTTYSTFLLRTFDDLRKFDPNFRERIVDNSRGKYSTIRSPNRIQNNDVADRAGRGKKTKKRNKRQREREKRKPFPPRRKDEKEETQHVDRWFLASGRGRRRGWGVDFNPSNRSSPGRFLLGWLAARPTDHLSKTHTTPMQEKSTMFHGSSRSGGRLAPAYDTGDGCTNRNLVHSTGRQEHYVLYAPSYRRTPTLCTPAIESTVTREDRDFKVQNRLSPMYTFLPPFLPKENLQLLPSFSLIFVVPIYLRIDEKFI